MSTDTLKDSETQSDYDVSPVLADAAPMFRLPETLIEEVKRAETYRKSCMPCDDDMQRHYKGPGRTEKGGEGWTWYPENHYQDWGAGVLPQVVAANPVVAVSTVRPGLMGYVALAHEAGINRWIEDVQFQKIAERLGMDFGFSWAVALTTSKSYGQHGKYRPCVSKLSRKTFGFDPAARDYSEARYAFHAIACRKGELEERARKESGWDAEAVKALAVGAGVDEQGRPVPDTMGRDEVVYYEVWVPEITVQEGEDYHGAILTLAYCTEGGVRKAKWLRAPRGYYGPKSGPYTLIGCYVVPDEAYPLGPMAAVEANVREVNAHALQNCADAASFKRIGVYDETDTANAELIGAAKNGQLVGIKGFDKNRFMEATFGGATAEGVAYEELARARLNRRSGMADAAHAEPSGETATFNAIADKWSEARIGHEAGKLLDGLTDVLMKVMWFMHKDRRITIPMADIDPAQAEKLGFARNADGDYEFAGGVHKGSIDDLRLTIEVGSTARKDSVQRKAETMEFANWAAAMYPAVIANPHGNWDDLYALVGRTFGVRDGERYLDMEKANQLSEALAGAAGQDELPDVDPVMTPVPRGGLGGARRPYTAHSGGGAAPKPAAAAAKPQGFGARVASLKGPGQAPKPMAQATA